MGADLFFLIQLHFLFQTIAIQCGAKGNDQIGVASCIKLIDELSSGKNPDFDQFNWQIIPLLNPDGYDYSQTSGNELKHEKKCHKIMRSLNPFFSDIV